MPEQELYEEYKVPPQIWGWIMVIVFAIVISGFGMWAHHGIPDPPRYWHHGQLPDTPAESIYSSFQPSPVWTTKRIINPLPEGKPLEPENRPPEPGQ